MKATIYTRESSTRKLSRAKAKFYQEGTVFVLRCGKTWETLGAVTFAEARSAALQKELDIHKGRQMKLPAPAPIPTPAAPAALMLDQAIDTYLAEIQQQRKTKTHAAYSTALRYFYECVGNRPVSEISRADLLGFSTYLRGKKQSPRTVYNKFESVVSFLKRHDITGKSLKITAHDWPQVVEAEPEIYEQEMLDRFFAVCNEDERLLFEFFLFTGCREQEVMHMTDRCIDFAACTVTVRQNPEFGWTPKMYKERTIPAPAALIAKLKAMLVKRGKGGLLFPTANGKPTHDFLDTAKRVAKRAGIPEDEVWLHRFRSTFCTRALWAGIDLRTVQDWMGHTDLASTMRYLRPDRAVLKDRVEAIWKT